MATLNDLLAERQPVAVPSPQPKLPPAWKRFLTALKMQDAYRNNWEPNPMLLRITEGKK